jgi:adenosine deaminase
VSEPCLDRFIERMPKAELHVHLEGAIRPATLLRLASRHRVDLPASTAPSLSRSTSPAPPVCAIRRTSSSPPTN